MTQPAASLAIHSLEELLGVTLFERSPRGFVATPYARVILQRGNRAFSLLTEAMSVACGEGAEASLIARKLLGMTTAQLIAISALQCARNFNAAAAELAMQPQSLRRTLIALEGWLGFPILKSDDTGFILTPKGQQVGQLISRAVAEIKSVRTEIREMDSKIDGTVVIGSVRAAASHLIPEVILRLNQQYPCGRFNVIRESYDVMMEGLEAARLDYVCTTLRPKLSPGLTGQVLATSQLRVLCSANHPLAGKEVNITDLIDYPWVGPTGETEAAMTFRQLFEQQGLTPPEFAIETFATEWTQDLVMRSNYLLLCRTTPFSGEIPPLGMVYLKGIVIGDPHPIWLIHRKDFRPTHFQTTFENILNSVCNASPVLLTG
ncbi:DNA-binding transcriptional LysR family regulator [Erwinia toletana]|uniref:DNA-binding transcriptional LysR family regulator n=2 Tax=Winslowiella toletana TaxID=92490 RepID=A0ABS4P2F0_9GAMM|nr:DNA-binding transcriptional LysR family regulator [Winslowiella toletana]